MIGHRRRRFSCERLNDPPSPLPAAAAGDDAALRSLQLFFLVLPLFLILYPLAAPLFAIESPESIPNPDGAAERLNKKEGRMEGREDGREVRLFI